VSGPQRYTTRPFPVEAIQFDGSPECFAALRAWLHADEREIFGGTLRADERPEFITLQTSQGYRTAVEGDYVVKSSVAVWICPKEVFEAAYEQVDPDTQDDVQS
jgi:hypothetical protein